MQNKARSFLLAAGGLLALIVLLTLLAWAFVHSELFKNRIEGFASQVMGMELKVNGPVRTLLFPVPGLRLEDIHMRNDETEWINASGVDLRVRALPLLRGQVEIDSIVLVESNLQLKRDSQGILNFIPARRPDDSNQGRILKIRRFRALDANLTFTDQASGEVIEAQGCEWTGRNLEWRSAGSNSSEFNLPDFQGSLICGKVIYDVMEATGLEAEVSAQGRRLKVSPVTGMLFDGQLKAQLESDFSGSSPHHAFELELADFRVERFIETFHQERGAEGSLTFVTQLNFSGKMRSEMVASLDGWATLSGTQLLLRGLDLDEQLDRYESTQRFNLVDIAAFFVAGPAGLAITRGYGFASLFADTGEQTAIQELISEWDIENGIARARDVALSTAKNRLALAGGLDFVNSQFKNIRVAVVDAEGCAVMEQLIHGEFQAPEIEKPHFLVTLAGPLLNILERGVALFKDTECEPFYTGRLELP
jgi:uncharacterized protein involved in outer membrane biogenesis